MIFQHRRTASFPQSVKIHNCSSDFITMCIMFMVGSWYIHLCLCLMCLCGVFVDASAVDPTPVSCSAGAAGQHPSAVTGILRVHGRDTDIHCQVTGLTLSISQFMLSLCLDCRWHPWPFKGQSYQLVTLCYPDLTYIFNFWHSGSRMLALSARVPECQKLKM